MVALAHNAFLVIRTVESFEPQYIGYAAAEQRCDYHNRIVSDIKSGNKEVEKYWKTFFLNEELKKDRKLAEKKAKLAANGFGLGEGGLVGCSILAECFCPLLPNPCYTLFVLIFCAVGKLINLITKI